MARVDTIFLLMIKLLASLMMVLSIGQDDSVLESALKGWRHPWADFGDGATVTYKETTKRPEIDGAGNFVLRNVETRVVWTLSGVDGERGTIKIASDGRESEFPHHFG